MLDDRIGLELSRKIKHTCDLLQVMFDNYESPALLCSFGKDSTVLLWIITHWYKKIPVIEMTHAYNRDCRKFAESIITTQNLEVYNLTASSYALNVPKPGWVVAQYQIDDFVFSVPIGFRDPGIYTRGKTLCGLDFFSLKVPRSNFTSPYNLLITARKTGDYDAEADYTLTINSVIEPVTGKLSLANPLENWTNQDVWKFIEFYEVPYNTDRYLNTKGLVDNHDCDTSYLNYCNACLISNNSIPCPKLGLNVNGVYDRLPKVKTLALK